MSINDTLCFADNDPVTGAPKIDGFTGILDDLVVTHEADAGYAEGSRLTFGNGSGFPPVIFQGIKSGNFLNFAFFSRFDLTFDTRDVVVIALKPIKTAPQTDARRIDVFPVWDARGADETSGLGGPAGTPDDHPPGVPLGADYVIRTNHSPQKVVHYRGVATGGPWSTLNPTTTPYTPTGMTIKTRSWQPPVPTLTTASSAQTLNGAGVTFNVVSTVGFPTAGVFAVGGQIVKYTGKTTTAFTGCNFTASVSVTASSGVSIPEAAWSVEVQVPLTKALGGSDWIDILDSFGLYFAVIRTGKSPASSGGSGTGSSGFFATQQLFPVGTLNYLTGTLDETKDIPAAWYGTGLIPALQSPPGANLGEGVSFVNDEQGLGIRPVSAAAGSALGTNIRGSGATEDNRLVARVKNTGSAAASNVTVEFRFANWGLGPATFPAWAPASGAVADYATAGVTIPTGGVPTELTWTWPRSSIPSAYLPPHDHQCGWAQLTSTSAVNFTQSSVRRNLDFVDLSQVERTATVSGVGYPAARGGRHDFLLFTQVRQLVVTRKVEHVHNVEGSAEDDPDQRSTVYWLWITTGFRRTGEVLKIDGQAFEILDERPGAFGLVAKHEQAGTAPDVLTHELTGGGIHNLGGGCYALAVPDGGSVDLGVRLEAAPAGAGPDNLLDRLLALIDRLQALLERLLACVARLDPLGAMLRRLALLLRGFPVRGLQRDVLAKLLDRLSALQQRVRVLLQLRDDLQELERAVNVLDHIFDKLGAVDQKKREELIQKLFGARGDKLRKSIAALEVERGILAALLHRLERLYGELEKLVRLCHEVDSLYALLLGLLRSFKKLRSFSDGLGGRFPLLDRLLPEADPDRGALGARLVQLQANAAKLDAIGELLATIAVHGKEVAETRSRLEAFDYEDVARAVERLYRAAIG